MKNKLTLALVCALVVAAGIALANRYEELSVGKLVVETSITNSGTESTTGAKTVTGRLTAAGGVTATDPVILTAGTANVTNGEPFTVSEPVHVLTGISNADGATNVITLANCSAALVGQKFTLIVGNGTNLVGLADSGNLRLSAAFNGATNSYSTITLYAVATNIFAEVCRSAN